MSSIFLLSFILFFQVQVESIRQSGFYRLVEKKYPTLAADLNQFETEDEEMVRFQKLTGIKAEDIVAFELNAEAFEGIEEKENPKLGSDFDFFLTAKLKGKINSKALISYILEKLEKEEGLEAREKVEKSRVVRGNVSTILLPVDILNPKNEVDTDLLFGFVEGKKNSRVMFGPPKQVEEALSGTEKKVFMKILDSMAPNRQLTFAIKIDPNFWNRPEFSANQQNPLLAGFSNSMKGIREIGLSLSFLDESLGVEVCVHCKDTQSALGLWTVAQGGLGMAQISMNQESGPQLPEILTRIKTEAIEKNVFVRVEVLPSDLDELVPSFYVPPSNQRNIKEESLRSSQ
ncbi:MAG: hypothetical protein CML14_05930 [Puniceicoccaceae bacterium]|nr:hypothetical protein [Puniceicoccaceae bacterium]